MKRAVALSIVAVLLLVIAGATAFTHRSYNQAVLAFRESRPQDSRDSEYAVVTRGVCSGMMLAEVNQRMGRPPNSRTMVTNSGSSAEPYMAVFDFGHEGYGDILGLKWNQVYIKEYYTVFFDPAKRATRIEYLVFDKSGETQRIIADLSSRTLSEPLQVPWSK